MAKTDLMTLVERFGEEKNARAFLESLRWPNGAICPHCGGTDPYKIRSMVGSKTRPGLYKCRACRGQFTVTVGTVMEDSHIKLGDWGDHKPNQGVRPGG